MSNKDLLVYGNKDVNLPSHLNFGKFILDNIRDKRDEIVLENCQKQEKLTYKEFTQYAINISKALKKLGVGRGDLVALGSEKRIEFVPTVLGVMFTGATYTSYEKESGRAVLKHKVGLTKPNYFICSKQFWETYKEILKEFESIKTFITLDDFEESGIIPIKTLFEEDVDINSFEPAEVQGKTDIACILYSSGTTGMPKGVQLTHLNFILNSLPEQFKDESLKTGLVCGLWYHNYDTFMTFKFIALGRKIAYVDDLQPQMLLKGLSHGEVNIAFIVPALICYLAKVNGIENYNLDCLKIIYSRSSPLHNKTIQEIKRRFPKLQHILQGYGMTEAGELTSESYAINGPKPGSVGKPSPAMIMKVVDPITRERLGPNQRGEICMTGPVMMKGYINVDPTTYLDEEGYFKTGDLGYYDEDEHFYIVERLKEIIVYNGFKIAPLELETILQLHPGVREAGVVGKPLADHGELPTAFVVKQPGVEVTEKELMDYVAAEVLPYMQLQGGVTFIDQMPRNNRGKIVRQRLRDMLA